MSGLAAEFNIGHMRYRVKFTGQQRIISLFQKKTAADTGNFHNEKGIGE